MSRWYRAYEGTVTDPKIGEAAMLAGCSRSVAIAAWHAILEDAAHCQGGGAIETTPRRISVVLVEPLAVTEALFAAFAEIGMIADGAVKAWKARQYESDSSTERSRKHRETKRNGDATLQERCETVSNDVATPPDTDTESEKKGRSFAAPADAAEATPPKPLSPLDRLWIEGVPILTDLGVGDRQARGCVGRWLKAARDVPLTVLDAIQRARDHRVVDPIAWITRNLTEAPRHERSHRNGSLSDAFDSLDARLAGGEGAAHRHRGPELDLAPGDGLPGFAGRFG